MLITQTHTEKPMSEKSIHERITAGEAAVPTLNFSTQLVTTASGEPTGVIFKDLEISIDSSDMEEIASFTYSGGGSIEFDSTTLSLYSYEIELDDEIEIGIDKPVDGTIEPGDMSGTPVELFDFGVSLLAAALEKMNTAAIQNANVIVECRKDRADLTTQRDNWMRIAQRETGVVSNARRKVTEAQGHMNRARLAVEENRTSDAIDSINLAMSLLLGLLAPDVGDQEEGS